jgi:hypothetical protein
MPREKVCPTLCRGLALTRPAHSFSVFSVPSAVATRPDSDRTPQSLVVAQHRCALSSLCELCVSAFISPSFL